MNKNIEKINYNSLYKRFIKEFDNTIVYHRKVKENNSHKLRVRLIDIINEIFYRTSNDLYQYDLLLINRLVILDKNDTILFQKHINYYKDRHNITYELIISNYNDLMINIIKSFSQDSLFNRVRFLIIENHDELKTKEMYIKFKNS